jgi:hypothetical protein
VQPKSITDSVGLLVPQLQKRGIYWTDYAVLGGTLKENIQAQPSQLFLSRDQAGAKLRGVTPTTTPYIAAEATDEPKAT